MSVPPSLEVVKKVKEISFGASPMVVMLHDWLPRSPQWLVLALK